MGSPLALSGKAVPAPVRARTYTPSEFSGALSDHGIYRCERWVAAKCAAGEIATNPAFKGRYIIPQSELFRMAGIKEAAH